ncbi:CACTA en-spm transposon protein [Cucumis melo var. makuwa]|uniref:CACTA en-spm transposon protein n=1 Tax=Cucumis melo var. makuwa TaxID=1194695 RepID=A0A5D3BWA8_CUCMM|nr:CACTA en-spm transposon protein [Cucumis melo var. makuwa]TYK03414.1 CACTA en-spm transposon protein [Cucumis melo var. makuwa]
MDKHIKDDTLCSHDVDLIVVERPIVRHVANDFIDDGIRICLINVCFSMSTSIMSSFPSSFEETNQMFIEFGMDINIAKGLSSADENSAESTQPPPTPRRSQQSRLLELERYVHTNGRIPMSIALGAKKPISPHAVRFSQAIGMCVRRTFPVCCFRVKC